MTQPHKTGWKPLLISMTISLGAGGLGALLTGSSTEIYKTLERPPLAPPSIVFPIMWTVLYLLMGWSAYLVYKSANSFRQTALTLYGVQLVVNLLWPPIFFSLRLFLFAFVWLCVLWGLILTMIIYFCKVNRRAAYLQVPYLLWVTFAGYLNLGIYLLNR